jgi:hypothetical protein
MDVRPTIPLRKSSYATFGTASSLLDPTQHKIALEINDIRIPSSLNDEATIYFIQSLFHGLTIPT